MFVEMCGCPGCGKSTLMKEIVCILKASGKIVLTEEDLRIKSKILLLLNKIGLLMSFRNFRLKRELLIFWANSGYGIHSFRYLIRVLEVKQYRQFQNNVDYLILDEGALQHLSSISHEKKINVSDSLINIIYHSIYEKNAIVLNCVLPYEINVQRLLCRQRKGDRFIKDNDNETIEALKLKKSNIESILNIMNLKELYEINTENLEGAINASLKAIRD